MSFCYDYSNPSWNEPKLFSQPITIDLSSEQSLKVYTAIINAGIPKLHTDPCSLVNLEGGYMIHDYLVCQFSCGGSFIFASQDGNYQLEDLANAFLGCFRTVLSFRERRVFRDQFFDLNNHGITAPDSPGLHLHLASRCQILSFQGNVVTIGSSPDSDIAFPPKTNISGNHAVLRQCNGEWYITNCSQDNTVTLNGTIMAFKCSLPLREGDVIGLGGRQFLTVWRIIL